MRKKRRRRKDKWIVFASFKQKEIGSHIGFKGNILLIQMELSLHEVKLNKAMK